MNWDVIEGNWKQVKGKLKQQWGELTDDQLDRISGKREQLVGQIQECYGVSRDGAERQVGEWEARNEKLFKESLRRIRKNAKASKTDEKVVLSNN
jgi:uncharacterized protein YjbJ (UPF0337 family)